MERIDEATVARMVSEALAEDGVRRDVTVRFLGIGSDRVEAEVRADRPAVVCGGRFAERAFRTVDEGAAYEAAVPDGRRVEAGGLVATVSGPAWALLSAERVALNFLQRLSGIATFTARFVEAVADSGVTILDTRKTTPLWRDAEKYAVRCGGGQNHRRNLESMVLVKENHIRAVGGRGALLERLRRYESDRAHGAGAGERRFVEVEVDSIEFLREVLTAPVDRVMLDNFTPRQVREALRIVEGYRRGHPDFTLEVEISGGVTLENVSAYALGGVDYISVGAITHSAPAASMSMEVV